LTEPELQECCRYWQKVLRLNDVEIEVRFARKLELDCTGQTQFTSDNNAALIQICPNTLANLDTLWMIDEEVTLVHELVHVQERTWAVSKEFRDLLQNKAIDAAHEAGIERTAQALVTLRRQTEEKH
jgi:hypothetical protein